MVERKRYIFALGGGKGGIGKSFLSANIAAALSNRDLSIALIDLDLGGANQHTLFGIDRPKKTIDDFIEHRVRNFSEILFPVPGFNIMLAAGIQNDLKATNFNAGQKSRLFSAIKSLDFDYIIIDIGAGMSISTLDTFNIATNGVFITYPEPTSVENCYKFLKSAFLRELRQKIRIRELKEIIDNIYDGRILIPPGIKIIDYFASVNEELTQVARSITSLKNYFLILNNMLPNEFGLIESIPYAIRRFYGFDLIPLGGLLSDELVKESIKKMEPYIHLFPDSENTKRIYDIAQNIINFSTRL